ncbi:VOC family protein [Umezawaea beigongshangensis]|uniref:VOC family protein n=1 Tax=Umezawaea beigongshangensis TaxID=2780383 RepID=UPI0034D58EAA
MRPERRGSAFACVDPSGVDPRPFFQRVPEGEVVKNRLHLDVRVGTGLVGEERLAALEAECARLIALGAVRVRLLRADGVDESCPVMQDVEGDEFWLDRGDAGALPGPPHPERENPRTGETSGHRWRRAGVVPVGVLV